MRVFVDLFLFVIFFLYHVAIIVIVCFDLEYHRWGILWLLLSSMMAVRLRIDNQNSSYHYSVVAFVIVDPDDDDDDALQ